MAEGGRGVECIVGGSAAVPSVSVLGPAAESDGGADWRGCETVGGGCVDVSGLDDMGSFDVVVVVVILDVVTVDNGNFIVALVEDGRTGGGPRVGSWGGCRCVTSLLVPPSPLPPAEDDKGGAEEEKGACGVVGLARSLPLPVTPVLCRPPLDFATIVVSTSCATFEVVVAKGADIVVKLAMFTGAIAVVVVGLTGVGVGAAVTGIEGRI